MTYTQLGDTDLHVSRICFGCWQLSPKFWGEVDLAPWRKAVRSALDVGVNFIDTADAYGDGFAEATLGEFLAREKLRDRFVIATKFYWNFEQEERHPDTRYEYILRECDASLKRLRTDRIDLYQIHAFDPLTVPDEVAAALGQLKKAGKVRWIGVSNQNAEQMRMYEQFFRINCLHPPYSLLKREIESNELPYCLGRRIGVIPYSPLFRGLLTGKYGADHTFNDSRAQVKYFNGKAYQHICEGVDALRPIGERYGLDPAQLAIRWVLTHPAVTAAIVGIKKPDHITGIVKAADDTLPVDEWHRVGRIMSRAKKEADNT